jgi:hypothetical protein
MNGRLLRNIPPNLNTALNMPGQRKQTKATMPSWMRGEAYQLVENLPILLFFCGLPPSFIMDERKAPPQYSSESEHIPRPAGWNDKRCGNIKRCVSEKED